MSVLRFRVTYEEDDGVYRDIEIKPSQTLIEFESVVISSYNLPANGNGQFYLSNDNWQKGKKISAAPVPEEKKPKGKSKAQTLPVLVSYIDDPHQRFLYEYHGTQEFIFLIELTTVGGAEKGTIAYPVCVRSQGPSPFKKEDTSMHYTRRGVAAAGGGGEEDDEEDDEVAEGNDSVFGEPDVDEEDLKGMEEESTGDDRDLMDGDAIEVEKDDDGVDVDISGEEDFDTETFDEPAEDVDEDDDLR